MAKKVYYQDRARDVLVTDEMARLGSDNKVWWIPDLDRAAVKTVRRVRWDVVLCAVAGGLLCEACLVFTGQSGIGVLLAFVFAVVGGLAIATQSANCYRARVRTKRWMVDEALESSDKADIKVVVDAVNKAIEEFRTLYGLPAPRKDIPL